MVQRFLSALNGEAKTGLSHWI